MTWDKDQIISLSGNTVRQQGDIGSDPCAINLSSFPKDLIKSSGVYGLLLILQNTLTKHFIWNSIGIRLYHIYNEDNGSTFTANKNTDGEAI